MRKLFEGEIYEIVAQPSGVVFSYCRGTDEERVLVAYKMISIDSGTITDVAKNIYMLSKFGSNYRAAAAVVENYVTAKSLVLSAGSVFVCSSEGEAAFVDDSGEVSWKGELKYKGNAPAAISLYKNSIWACFTEANALIKYNISTMREELRIGGARSPFDKPCDIFIEGKTAIVSNIGSNKLIRVDLESYTIEDFMEFNEPVYSYVSVKNFGFILTESGLYVIKE